MIPNSSIKIETEKFPILDDEEPINEGMYGKALCQYLQSELTQRGISAPRYCDEDWGWWLEVNDGDFHMGLCIYSDPNDEGDPSGYAILPSIQKAKKWSWTKFRTIDQSGQVLSIIDHLENIFHADPEITSVSRHDDFPY